jgi:methylated-DNA-[protein]-cysteine S-methyltransferase
MNTPQALFLDHLATPIGNLILVADNEARLHHLVWPESEEAVRRELARHYGPVTIETVKDPGGVSSQVQSYFAGDLAIIDNMPVVPIGTPFQLKVWAALREIPAGEPISYGDMARRIGHPDAFRAVGMACNANPVAVVVPCHRVVGSGGAMVGFGGGIPRKQWLLAHEAKDQSLSLF